MPSRGGISGIAVAMATVGGFLIYTGVRDLDFQDSLREILKGQLPTPQAGTGDAVSKAEAALRGDGGGSGDSGGGSVGGAADAKVGDGPNRKIAVAAFTYQDDVYSQPKRNQAGFSDCSSFVGKALRKAGITPPGGSVTGSYLVWKKLKQIPRSEIKAGDLLCGVGHIAIAINSTTAIGQQSRKSNVKVDTIDNIMFGQNGWVAKRYVGGG